ncbi:MAG: MFS transporter [Myxococcales bacterium]|nr:MFS transporter [Myxococcales bacterium]
MSWPEELPTSAAPPSHAPFPPRSFREGFIARLEDDGRYPNWVLFAALAGMFATTFPITILTIALGSIASEFAVRETTIAWVITAPMLCSAVALPLMGKLGDLHGHRRIFLLGFGAATVTAVATAFAWSAGSLIGLRTLAAVVGGATGPTSMALIFSVYEPGQRVRAMGWWSMTGAAAPALGLILGGPLVDLLGWRVVFLLQAVLSVAALGLAAMVLRETERHRVRFDLAGAGVLALSVGAFMFALARAREAAFLSPDVAGAIVVGLLAIPWFVRIERRTAEPLLALEFFRRRNFTAPMLSNAFQGAAYMGAFVLAPIVLLRIFGFSISQAAGIMLLRTLTLTLASPLGGRLGTRIGERAAASIGSLILTGSLMVIAWSAGNGVFVGFAVGLVLQGLGHGLALPSLSSAVANAVPERDLGIASAGSRLTSTVGTAFGITVLTLVYGGDDAGPAFLMAFGAGAGFAALSAVAALCMQDPQEGTCPDAIRSA